MLRRTLGWGVRLLYKRNSSGFINRPLYTLSTNQNKINNMEDVKDLEKKVEEVKLEQPEVKPEAKVEENAEAKAEGKKEKKKKEKAEKGEKGEKKEEKPAEDKNEVGPKLFSQIDIRVADIVECWKHPESENLFCEKVSVCGEIREIASGLQKFVPIEQMTGKVIIMANLKPRPLAGFLSNGMVVCASNEDHTAVELLIPDGENGERCYLEGHEDLFIQGDIQPVLNPKKKILEKCVEHFKTDAEGFVTWMGIKLRTKAGPIKAATINNGHVS